MELFHVTESIVFNHLGTACEGSLTGRAKQPDDVRCFDTGGMPGCEPWSGRVARRQGFSHLLSLSFIKAGRASCTLARSRSLFL